MSQARVGTYRGIVSHRPILAFAVPHCAFAPTTGAILAQVTVDPCQFSPAGLVDWHGLKAGARQGPLKECAKEDVHARAARTGIHVTDDPGSEGRLHGPSNGAACSE